jgi:hypothetical protein
MPFRSRARLSYANVAATLALVLALTSPAWSDPVAHSAATLAQQVKQVAGQSKKARRTATSAKRTADSASKKADQAIAASGRQGPQGLQGLQGPQGGQGPQGATGAAGATNVVVRTGGAGTPGTHTASAGCVDGVPNGSKGYRDAANALVAGGCAGGVGGTVSVPAVCNPGEVAVGGGHSYADQKRHAIVTESRPQPSGAGQTPTAWQLEVETLTNDSSNNTAVTPYVICASP